MNFEGGVNKLSGGGSKIMEIEREGAFVDEEGIRNMSSHIYRVVEDRSLLGKLD